MKMIKRTLRERLFETPWRPLDKDRPQTEAERMQERAQKARTTAEALGVSSIDPLLMPRRRDQQTPDRFEMRAMWGSIDANGHWQHNPRIAMTRADQYTENVRRGFLLPSGYR